MFLIFEFLNFLFFFRSALEIRAWSCHCCSPCWVLAFAACSATVDTDRGVSEIGKSDTGHQSNTGGGDAGGGGDSGDPLPLIVKDPGPRRASWL